MKALLILALAALAAATALAFGENAAAAGATAIAYARPLTTEPVTLLVWGGALLAMGSAVRRFKL